MHSDDARRELDKISRALEGAERYLILHNQTNAALHMNETVLHSPLTLAVINARQSAERLRTHLESMADA
jgi:hypothetical protein